MYASNAPASLVALFFSKALSFTISFDVYINARAPPSDLAELLVNLLFVILLLFEFAIRMAPPIAAWLDMNSQLVIVFSLLKAYIAPPLFSAVFDSNLQLLIIVPVTSLEGLILE